MRRIRIIPVLGIDGSQLVKTVAFKNPNYIGDPLNAIKIFNDKEVDELTIVDIRASKNKAEPNYRLIGEMAGECFMPLAYGGGINQADQARRLFDSGVEKVIIGSAFYNNPDIVTQLAVRYGAQSIVVCLDVDKGLLGKWKVKSFSGTRKQAQEPEAIAVRAANAGAGEIILHAIHKEGAMSGYDLPLVQLVSAAVTVPVVALGGARGIPDFLDAIQAGASAVAASSTFVYNRNNVRSILINYPTQKQLSEELFNKI